MSEDSPRNDLPSDCKNSYEFVDAYNKSYEECPLADDIDLRKMRRHDSIRRDVRVDAKYNKPFNSCPPADDIDLPTARKKFPMTSESVESFKEVKELAGLTHEANMEKFIYEMESEFNLFVKQMRTKFRTLKTLIPKN